MPARRKVAIDSRTDIAGVAERILELAASAADQAEALCVESASVSVNFEANAIKGSDANDRAAAALRIIKDGRVGFSSTSNLDDLQGLVDAALETAPFGAEARFDFPGPQDFPDAPAYDDSVEEMTVEEMASLGERVIADVRAASPLDVTIEGGVSKSLSRMALFNSNGGGVSYARSGSGAGFGGTVIRGEDMLFTSDSVSSVAAVADASEVVASVLRQLEWARETAHADTKTMPVILLPGAVSRLLLSSLLSGFSGKSVLHGISPLIGRLGDRIVAERFSLTDDATLGRVPGSRPGDDEGVASRRLPLIEAGVARTFLYDLQTAGQAGTESTGSGERGVASLPGPSSSVLVVGEGDTTLDDMIAGMDEGVIVEKLLGAGQGNILGGDFSAALLLGYKVERGKVVGRVKDTMISGNAYAALNDDLIAIGSERRWRGSLCAPPIAVGGVSVSSAAKG